jgi:large subunit ribosomal protein L13
MRTTYIAKPDLVERKWYVVDASGQTLGRLSSEIAKVLRGKHKPIYTPHVDTGDYVIIINAEKIAVSGKKMEQKQYFRHSGYIGGVKLTPLKVMLDKKPEYVLYHAVKGMLPKNTLGRTMLKKLNIYAGSEHKHAAQKPEELKF